MTVEDKSKQLFRSVRAVYIALAAYVKEVSKEIGMEKAMGLLSKTFREVGTYQGKKLKKVLGKEKANANEVFEILKIIPKSTGINYMFTQKDPDKVVTRLDKCPIFESANIIGLDTAQFCDNTAIPYFDAAAKQFNNNLEFRRNKVKTTENDFCEEELSLKQD